MKRYIPTRRRLIQLYAALLYNARLKGFADGKLYTGAGKNVCVPGLNCYSCPAAVGACPLGSLQNALASGGGRFPAYVLGTLMLFGLLLGRVVCGFLCPFGLIQELLHKIPAPKLRKSRVTRILSYMKYLMLAALVVAVPLIRGMPGFCKYICPAGTLEGALPLIAADGGLRASLGALFANKLVWLTVILVLSVFIFRVFCRFLCPLGAIYSLFSRVALMGVRVDEEKCVNCGLCARACGMDVRRAGDRECVHCGGCARVCPTGAISTGPRPRGKAVTVIACCALIAVMISVNIGGRPDARTGTEVGDIAPDFTVATFAGDTFTLTENRGETVIINFWATWCSPCVRELPEFAAVDDARVLAVHTGTVTQDPAAFLEAMDCELAAASDEDGSLFEMYGGGALPRTVIIAPDGTVIYNEVGAMDARTLRSLISGE